MAIKEVWRPIPGYEGYEASNLGRIRSVFRWVKYPKGHSVWYAGKVLKPGTIGKGYRGVVLPPQRMCRVHQLVMLTFVGPCPEGFEVRHLNNNRSDNRLSNLCYGTPKQNQADRLVHGTDNRRDRAPYAKLSTEAVLEIRSGALSTSQLMDKYRVSRSHIWNIQHGHARRWD